MLTIQLSNALSVPVIDRVGPAGTSWLRLCFGAVFLVVIVRPKTHMVRREDVAALVALGAATGLMTTLFFSAVARIPLGTAVAVEFVGPLTLAGLASKRRAALVWPLLALLGVVLLTQPWRGDVDPVGTGFALLAGVCWALYNLLTQHISDRFSGISGLSLTIPIAALVMMPVGLPQTVGATFDLWLLPAAAGIALLTPVVAFGLEMQALRRMTHTAFGTLLAIEPGFAVLIGLVVLAQAPDPGQSAGIALVVLAGVSAQRSVFATPRAIPNPVTPKGPQ